MNDWVVYDFLPYRQLFLTMNRFAQMLRTLSIHIFLAKRLTPVIVYILTTKRSETICMIGWHIQVWLVRDIMLTKKISSLSMTTVGILTVRTYFSETIADWALVVFVIIYRTSNIGSSFTLIESLLALINRLSLLNHREVFNASIHRIMKW